MSRPTDNDLEVLLRDLTPDDPPDMSLQSAEALTALSLDLPPVPPSAALRARLLASVARPEQRLSPFADRLARLIDVAHDRARELLASLTRPEVWERLLPGVELVHLQGGPAVAGADVGFVRVAAGATFPVHHHLGDEHVLVLQGAYLDSDGSSARAGDSVHLPAGSSHSFVAAPGADLVYAVVVGGVFFPGLDLSVNRD